MSSLRRFDLLTVTAALAILAPATAVVDSAGYKFKKCCVDAGIACPEMCVYPRPWIYTVEQAFCIQEVYPQYLKCATGGKDNRDCCRAINVDYNGDWPQCLDFCWPSDLQPDRRHIVCVDPINNSADKCNHNANNYEDWPT